MLYHIFNIFSIVFMQKVYFLNIIISKNKQILKSCSKTLTSPATALLYKLYRIGIIFPLFNQSTKLLYTIFALYIKYKTYTQYTAKLFPDNSAVKSLHNMTQRYVCTVINYYCLGIHFIFFIIHCQNRTSYF